MIKYLLHLIFGNTREIFCFIHKPRPSPCVLYLLVSITASCKAKGIVMESKQAGVLNLNKTKSIKMTCTAELAGIWKWKSASLLLQKVTSFAMPKTLVEIKWETLQKGAPTTQAMHAGLSSWPKEDSEARKSYEFAIQRLHVDDSGDYICRLIVENNVYLESNQLHFSLQGAILFPLIFIPFKVGFSYFGFSFLSS